MLSAALHLPSHVRTRQFDRASSVLEDRGLRVDGSQTDGESSGAGSLVFCWVAQPDRFGGFASLGKRGKPAERVADEAVGGILAFLESGASVDSHLADQLVLPAALAPGISRWTVQDVTSHMRTNVWVAEQFGYGGFMSAKMNKIFQIEYCNPRLM
jgi:RNA 3'-terminal phosphate cyclase (ATP)